MAGDGCTDDNGRRTEMKNRSPLVPLGGAVLIVAVLCTLLVKGGWLIGLPALLALAVVACLAHTVSR